MTSIDLTSGALLPPVVRPAGLAAWNRYAAVNHEFVPIHMDDEAGRKAGFDSAIGQGNLQWAYYHIMLRTWLGGNGRIDQVNARYKSPSVRDTVVTVQGRIASTENGDDGTRVTIEIWAEDDHGRQLSNGEAIVTVAA